MIHKLKVTCLRLLYVAMALVALPLQAATITAISIADLQNKINAANPGDIINLANGHYNNTTLNIAKNGITVQAATSGGVYLDGTDAITISGNTISFSGFQFVSGTNAGANVVTVTGNTNTITQLNFNGYSASKMIQISGLNNTVSYCNFQNKPTDITATKGGDGDMLQIIPNATNPGNNVIRYCSFLHMPGGGGDWGNECIRIGDGAYSLMISRTVVEYCYFEDTGAGDSEAISVKSRENILRYNTMNNNPDAMFAFRNGDNNVAYGNFFIKSGGIRCKQANNIFCYNNYFEGAGTNQTSGLAGGGTAPVFLEYYGAGYGDNFNFIHNTFYGCTANIIETPLTNCTWANNIFYKSSPSIFSGTTSGQSFAGNIYNLSTVGLTIPSGMTNSDPKLVLNTDGYYGLSATSAGINGASATFPKMLFITGIDTLLMDIQGQVRPAVRAQRDVGCEEYNATGTVTNKPLSLANVGPGYLRSIYTNVPSQIEQPTLKCSYNSVSQLLSVDIQLQGNSNINLDVYSLSGVKIKSLLKNDLVSAGISTKTFDFSGVKTGVFLIQLTSGRFSKTEKIMIR